MIYGVYSIHDAKTGFLNITLDQSDESAIRGFEHACLNTDSLFFTHPADYALHRLGSFDTDTGSLTPLIPVDVLVRASDFMSVRKER